MVSTRNSDKKKKRDVEEQQAVVEPAKKRKRQQQQQQEPRKKASTAKAKATTSTTTTTKDNKKAKTTAPETTAAPAESSTSYSARKRTVKQHDDPPQDKKAKGKEKLVEKMDIDEEVFENGSQEEEEQEEMPDNTEDDDNSDDGDEDEDSIDWETIQLPPRFDSQQQQQAEDHTDGVQVGHEHEQPKEAYGDVEIVMEAPRPVLKKSNWEMAYQRNLRDWMHNCHVVLLVTHFKMRNSWLSEEHMKTVCSTVVPNHAKNLLSQAETSDSLITGIKWLLKWWSEYFTITGPGLSTRPYTDFIHLKDNLTLRALIDKNESGADSDYIEDFEAFLNLIQNDKKGTRDTSAQLFVAILRACGLDTRLVCSLQPLPYKIVPTPAGSANQSDIEGGDSAKKEKEEEDEKSNPVRFKFRAPSRTYVDPNVQLKQGKAKPPTVWAEIYCPKTEKWICVDPIRGHIDKPALMEPTNLNRSSRISFVLAFDPPSKNGRRGNVTDVTRRYTSNLEKALRLRERPLTKREKEGGMKLWSESFLDILSKRNKVGDRELLEQQALATQEKDEVMPTAIGNFKNHTLYALERHLKKFEILHPREPVLGSIRGEKIYPRHCVKPVSTADTYRKMGKEIKEGEQPVKMVKANAVTMEKRRLKEQAKQEGHDLMVACYGEWQTKPYVPPPIKNGKIPKNNYGTIDLFTPTMLPKGAAHIPIKGIAKIAKKLGIDYAEAVVDFEFMKMRAVPLVEGIVVAEKSKDLLLEAWEEHEQNEAMKSIAKQEKEVYVRWRKLIKRLLIKARVDNDYGKTEESSHEDKWSSFNKNKKEDDDDMDVAEGAGGGGGGGGGGFIPEDDE